MPSTPRPRHDSIHDMHEAVAAMADSEQRIKAARPAVDQAAAAFRLRSADDAIRRDPSPTTWANHALAAGELRKSLGGAR